MVNFLVSISFAAKMLKFDLLPDLGVVKMTKYSSNGRIS